MDPKQFDTLCAVYVEQQLAADTAKAAADRAKAAVIAAIESHGFVPTNAEASRRIEGGDWIGTVTVGSTVEIRDDVVANLELQLSAARRHNLFQQMFTRRVEYTMLKGAELVLPAANLPKMRRDLILALYAQCFIPRKKSPSLKVEAVTAVREREAKAAKKGGRK